MLLNSKSVDAFSGLGFNSFMSGSGVDVNYQTALSDSTVHSCIRIIAQTISTLPLKLYVKDNGATGKQWQEDKSSVMSRILTQSPNARQTAPEWIGNMVVHLALFSEYFALIQRSPKGQIIGIVPFNNPQQVSIQEGREGLIYNCVTNDGKSHTLTKNEILHIRDLSLNSFTAMDKIANAKSAIGLSLAATQNAEKYYKQGSRAGAFIQTTKKLSDDAASRLTRQFNDAYSSADSAHKIGILEDGMTYIPNTYNLRDAQVFEARQSTIREIAAIFGVPVSLLGVADPNLKDVESINSFFYKSCLQFIIANIEARFKDMLPKNYSLKFDVSEYLKGDVKTMVEVTERLFTRGLISRNEARIRMGLQPDTRDDLYVVSSNNLVFGGIEDFTNPDVVQQPQLNNTEEEEDVSKD